MKLYIYKKNYIRPSSVSFKNLYVLIYLWSTLNDDIVCMQLFKTVCVNNNEIQVIILFIISLTK